MFELAGELARACDDLGGRVAACSTQIKDQVKLTERYNPAAAALRDIQSLLEGIGGIVKGLPRGGP